MTQLSDKLIAVEFKQDDAHDFSINGNTLFFMATSTLWFWPTPVPYKKELPTGNYSILGIVPPKEIGFECMNAVQSFRSLLQSKGLDVDRNYLIIEKI